MTQAARDVGRQGIEADAQDAALYCAKLQKLFRHIHGHVDGNCEAGSDVAAAVRDEGSVHFYSFALQVDERRYPPTAPLRDYGKYH